MNKRPLLLTLLAILLTQVGFGQMKLSYFDTKNPEEICDAKYKITYKLEYVKDVTKPDLKSDDQLVLLIGDNTTKFYSESVISGMNVIEDYFAKNSGKTSYPNELLQDGSPYEIYQNYPTSARSTTIYLGDMLTDHFIIEEDMTKMEWQIGAEEQEINGYKCRKATTSFRGRDYIAWFTSDIPLSYGPWRFAGLPGLILKVSDSQNHYSWECIGLQSNNIEEKIQKYSLSYTKTTTEKLNKLLYTMHEDFIGYTRMVFSARAGKTYEGNSKPLKKPYNPIELK